MAYASSEEEKDKQQDVQGQSGGQVSGPTSGAVLNSGDGPSGQPPAAGAAPQAATTQAATPGSGPHPGNFVGIKQYLDANKAQSQRLAGNVGGYVNDLSNQARDTASKQQGLYNQAVAQNTVGYNPDLVNEAKTNLVSFANDPTKRAQFQNLKDATYKGPQDFQSSDFYNPTQQAFNKAQTAGEETQTEQGQRNLLNQYNQDKTGHTAGSGINNFDQMLLQGGGGKEALGKAREGQKDFQDILNNIQAQSKERARDAQNITANTRNVIQNEFGGQQQAIQDMLNLRAQDYKNMATGYANTLANKLNTGAQLDANDLSTLGLSQEGQGNIGNLINQIQQNTQGQNGLNITGTAPNALGLDLGQFVKRLDPNLTINAQNSATADEYAKYNALNQLMGTNNSFLSNPALAGTKSIDAADFDLGGAQNYLQKILGERQGAMAQQRTAQQAAAEQAARDQVARDQAAAQQEAAVRQANRDKYAAINHRTQEAIDAEERNRASEGNQY